ncbi:acyl-CoA dehydrogenase family protein [Microbacterium sp. 179-B 1A2 NHS]|uniref:acyl-CoA dehydrogenase family protein n=1 Tax=Microbacterium sp. 179-B 1A2 NHS TaxID=3142383 RepID=UPI0039A1AE0C
MSTVRPDARLRFAPVLERARADAVEREQDRRLLHDEVRALAGLGFGSARLPEEHGGEGIDLVELLDRVIDVAAADSNLGHVWRGHIGFVESLALEGWDGPRAVRWRHRIAAGDVIGNAQSERAATAELSTRVESVDGVVRLTGTKFYTTGSIYADWIHLAALDGDERVAVTVPARAPGVRIVDDWDGFGQPLTGSGTTTFTAVAVDPGDIGRAGEDPERWQYVGGVFQLSLLAVIAGIARRAADDTVDFVRGRRRTFGHSGEHLPADDPLVQEVVGELSGAASATRRLVLSIARDLDDARERLRAGAGEPLQEVQFEIFRAQRVIPELALAAATRLFEVGGASATSRTRALDRHWRNIRTIASHNPVAQRTRAVGDRDISGRLPQWQAPGAPTPAGAS